MNQNSKYGYANIGDRFNEWTVIEKSKSFHGIYKYLCRCSCGAEVHVSCRNLVTGKSTKCVSCARLKSSRPPKKEITSLQKEFNLLKVLRYQKSKNFICVVQCNCGNVFFIQKYLFDRGELPKCDHEKKYSSFIRKEEKRVIYVEEKKKDGLFNRLKRLIGL